MLQRTSVGSWWKNVFGQWKQRSEIGRDYYRKHLKNRKKVFATTRSLEETAELECEVAHSNRNPTEDE